MNNHGKSCRIIQADWSRDRDRIMKIRTQVFVEEQGVPPEIEIDGMDDRCWFVLAFDDDEQPVGTARLSPDGKVGRMAVLKPYRQNGIGSALMKAIIRIADENNLENLYLHGQVQAKSFYSLHGFEEEGDIFNEAGIPHVKMRLARH